MVYEGYISGRCRYMDAPLHWWYRVAHQRVPAVVRVTQNSSSAGVCDARWTSVYNPIFCVRASTTLQGHQLHMLKLPEKTTRPWCASASEGNQGVQHIRTESPHFSSPSSEKGQGQTSTGCQLFWQKITLLEKRACFSHEIHSAH